MPLRPMSTAIVALGRTSATTLRVAATAARRGTSTAGEILSRPTTPATNVRLRMPATAKVGIRAPTTTNVRAGPCATTIKIRRGVRATSTRIRVEATTTRPTAEVIMRDRRAATRASRVHRRTAATRPVLQTRMDRRAGSARTSKASHRTGPTTMILRRPAAVVLGTNMRRRRCPVVLSPKPPHRSRTTAVILRPSASRRSRPTTMILRPSAPRRSGRSTTVVLRTEVPRRPGTTVFKPMPTTARPTVRKIVRLPRRGTTRTDHSVSREVPGARRGSHRRPTVVHRLPEVPVARGKVLMISLQRSSFEVMITLRNQLV
jgi:hypothetical protein